MTNAQRIFVGFLTSVGILMMAGCASTPQAWYEGERLRGVAHGQGTTTWANGNKYVGGHRRGHLDGQGTFTWANGDKYVGGWRDSQLDGQGTFTSVNGNKYVGEFRRNNMGQGTSTYADGSRFVGEHTGAADPYVIRYLTAYKIAGLPLEGTFFLVSGSSITGRVTNHRELSDGVEEFSINDVKYIHEWKTGKFYRADGVPLRNDSEITVAQETASVNSNKTEGEAKPQSDAVKSPPDKRERLALLIGNANYQTSRLANPVNDVRGMATALRKAGFTVIKHENLNFRQMREAVRDFGEKLSKDHVGFFYYSGHGVQVDGKNYLIPINSDIKYEDEVATSALDADLVLAKLESAKNKLNIVVLDACRDSPLGRGTRTSTKGLSNMNAASGTMIAFSTAPGDVALDGKGSNSPYTKYLIRAIQKEGLLLEQVFKEVRGNVMKDTNGKQVPWENSSILGDFYFVPKKAN